LKSIFSRILLLILTNELFLNSPVQALQTRSVYSQDAQGIQGAGVELKIWAGYGLTINFIPSGETISHVWIGDPTHFVFSSNGSLCQKIEPSQKQSCESDNQVSPTVLFIRQVRAIKFPNILSSEDGSTQLTVITVNSLGQKQYQFRLKLASGGTPEYTSLIIRPDSEKPSPILLRKENRDEGKL
jgi:hypothetical protein